MKNIAVLVSGGGTNLQALIDAENRGEIDGGKITSVISSKKGVFALERAKNANIPFEVLERSNFSDNKSYSEALLKILKDKKIDLIVLAGFMIILDSCVIKAYPNKIINIHPSLIPSFCGDGFYGLQVHKAALEKGVKITGATVHFVNEITDGGAIILQETVPVLDSDTPESLQKRVMEQVEWKILPKSVSLFCSGRLKIDNNRVFILAKGEI